MLKSKFKRTDPQTFVKYGRMSDDSQNPLSPDQQFDTIDREIVRQRLPWTCGGTYRDDGIKGAYIGKRPGLQAMLRDIHVRKVKPTMVIVDTAERFGRADEIPAIRLMLQNKYGVLLLTVDSGLTDPTTTAGKAVQFVEQIRSTAGNEVKAHDVLRGKMDLAKRKLWPGGPPPMGYKLEKTIGDVAGRQTSETRLVPDEATALLPRKAFMLAHTTGAGGTTIAAMLNADTEVPDRHKPVRGDTVDYWLDNPVYGGTLRFNRVCTGIVDDVRRQQRNDEDEVMLIHGFCQPLIDPEVVARVRDARARRRQQRAAALGKESPPGPAGVGLVLKYPLTGLIYCHHCGSRMNPSLSSGKVKAEYRKLYYRCPLAASGACVNTRYTRGDHLWSAVVAALRARLFPPPQSPGEVPAWVGSVVSQVRAAARQLSEQTPQRSAAIEVEQATLRERMQGWQQSLGNPKLPGMLRQDLEAHYQRAAERATELDQQLADLRQHERRLEDVVDAKGVLQKLRTLDEVLARGNPSDVNFELSLHVEGIDVGADGTVTMRTCRLGCFEGAVELLSDPRAATRTDAPRPGVVGGYRVKNRRRGSLRLSDAEFVGGGSPRPHEEVFVVSAERFDGLADQWFWADPLPIGRPPPWHVRHAAAVAAVQTSDPQAWSLQNWPSGSASASRRSTRRCGTRRPAAPAGRQATPDAGSNPSDHPSGSGLCQAGPDCFLAAHSFSLVLEGYLANGATVGGQNTQGATRSKPVSSDHIEGDRSRNSDPGACLTGFQDRKQHHRIC